MIARVESFCLNWWWVVLFLLFCSALYEQGLKKRNREYGKLYQKLMELHQQKEEALALNEKLLRQVNSQSDPAWVELVLMKGLGLVPEGQIKVFFRKEE